MISVVKDYNNPPAILSNNNRTEKLAHIIQQENGTLYSNTDYAPKVVKEVLEGIYKEKCGYCESKIKQAGSLQVEHYRPKAKVDEDLSHKGYYWLGLEWSNLLLACPNCNQPGAKGNQFPIQGTRTKRSPVIIQHNSIVRTSLLATNTPLINERPLLLNPEINNPRIHFYFDSDAIIHGRTDEGRATINICRLNREPLVGCRQEIRLELLNLIEIAIELNRRNQLINGGFESFMQKAFEKIEAQQNSNKVYSLWGWYMFHYFEKCFLSAIDNPIEKKIVWELYKSYKQGNL